MLGRFLELALVTEDTGAAWQRWQSLGFAPATTGDTWSHAYGVVACGPVAIGFHGRGEEPVGIVFVRPDVAGLHRELLARNLDVELARLGSDVFNEIALREPGGLLLRVIEARTFSPPPELATATALGNPVQISLPCRNLDDAESFCDQLGLLAERRESPWDCVALPGTPLAWHPRRVLAEPALVFESAGISAAAAAAAGGLTSERALSLAGDRAHQRLRTPDDLTLVVFE